MSEKGSTVFHRLTISVVGHDERLNVAKTFSAFSTAWKPFFSL